MTSKTSRGTHASATAPHVANSSVQPATLNPQPLQICSHAANARTHCTAHVHCTHMYTRVHTHMHARERTPPHSPTHLPTRVREYAWVVTRTFAHACTREQPRAVSYPHVHGYAPQARMTMTASTTRQTSVALPPRPAQNHWFVCARARLWSRARGA